MMEGPNVPFNRVLQWMVAPTGAPHENLQY